MNYFLAVDWDPHEARYVLAGISGRRVKVRAASSVRLVDVTEGAAEPRYSFGSSLSDALDRHNARRAKLLVAVPRSSIELMHFSLPPAKDDELPELVANLAMREAAAISDQWVLDFVPTVDDPNGLRRVTAAALSPEELDRVQRQCDTAGLKPSRLLLRPFASASVFLRSPRAADEVSLLVNRIECEVDLNVIAEDQVVFSRTARLPEGAGDQETTDRLLAEINRTLAAVPREQIGEEEIENVCVFGGPDDYEDLAERITDELSKPAQVMDPFAVLGTGPHDMPPDRGRFAALLGMLLDEATSSHSVDFLQPRRPPRRVGRWRLGLIAAGLAAVFLLAIGYNFWTTLTDVNSTNAKLTQERDKLKDIAKKATRQAALINAVNSWTRRDLNWLDELRDLSIRFPGPRDAVIRQMSMGSSPSAGGMIAIDGKVRDPKIVRRMEQQIRDQYRGVRSPTIRARPSEQDYTWSFDASIAVKPRNKDAYVSHLPEEQRAAPEGEATTSAVGSVAKAARSAAEDERP